MKCPKCNGESYLLDEEFVNVLSQTEPIKILVRALYVCRACGEKFSRLAYDELDIKRELSKQSEQKKEKPKETENKQEELKFF